MKLIVILILLFPLSFSIFFDSPINDISSHNVGVASSLSFYSSFTGNGESSVENPVSYANLTLELASSMVDGSILSGNQNYVIFSRNARYSSGGEYTEDGICQGRFLTEFKDKVFEGSVILTFHNNTVTIPINSGGNNYVLVPNSFSFEDSDGADNLTVTIQGSFHFTYAREDYNSVLDSEGTTCGSVFSEYDKIYEIPFYNSKNFTVSGRKYINLLIAPVTGEQWYHNNHFDNLVLSSRKFYLADVLLNGVPINSRRLKTFEINTSNGLQSIYTLNYNDSSNFTVSEYSVKTTPISIEVSNDSFAYIYAINSTYPAILGDNNLTLVLYDYFGNIIEINRTIRSNAVSAYGSLTDAGASSYVRKSAPFYYSDYEMIGGLGTIILIIFVLYSVRIFRN